MGLSFFLKKKLLYKGVVVKKVTKVVLWLLNRGNAWD